ncbi:MAG: PIN domain-containing protein [Saprospiraceae bacterium]|nr:PIN domain-containing protein [Saprospiraceae bacterium]
MKIFLDVNVLVSVLNKEFPIFSYSSRVLSLCDHPRFEVFTSPICLAIAFYFAEKKSGTQLAKEKINLLISKIKITNTDSRVVQQAIQNPAVHDFEDGIKYYSALYSDCKVIITEDKNDFYYSEIEVLGCVDFLKKYL